MVRCVRDPRCSLLCPVLAVLVALGGWARLAAAAVTGQQIADAIARLGDDDYRIRERAQKLLMSAGFAARPAVRGALTSGDIEVSARAHAILDFIELGVTPDMKPEVVQAARGYRAGDASAKRDAVAVVLAEGDSAVPILARLCSDEKDPALRRELFSHLPYGAKRTSRALLLDGNTETAAAVLQMYAAAGDENSAQDFAALLAAGGGIDAAITRWREEIDRQAAADKPDAEAAKLLAFLLRAGGDSAGAVQAARQARDPRLVRALAGEAGNWKLAVHADDVQGDLTDMSNLAQLSLERRRAGDADGMLQALDRLRALPWKDHARAGADAFFFNDRPRDGIAILIEHGQLIPVFHLLCARLDFEDAFALARREGAANPRLKLLAARERFVLGQKEAASAEIDAVEAAAQAAGAKLDLDFAASLIDAAMAMGRREKAMALAGDALDHANPRENIADLFDVLFPNRGYDAAEWWGFLRASSPLETTAARLSRLAALEDQTMPPDQLEQLARAADAAALRIDRLEDRGRWLQRIAAKLQAAGRDGAAWEELQKWADATGSTYAYRGMAEIKANAGDWAAAAKLYDRAAEQQGSQLDNVDAPLVWLRGWALAHAAATAANPREAAEEREQSGELLQLAHALPMATQAQRALLAQAIADHAGDDPALQLEAATELDLAGRVGAFDTGTRIDLLQVQGRSLEARGEFAAAALCFERAMVPGWPGSERTPLELPAATHSLRARAAAAAGDFKTAAAEANACLALLPGDAETVSLLAPVFLAKGHADELGFLYRHVERSLAAVAASYPGDAPAHFALARLELACDRNLDAALVHAETAVQLQQDDAACFDLLGRVRFKLGKKEQAIKAVHRAIELAPREAAYKHDLEMLQAAPGTAPSTVPARSVVPPTPPCSGG